MVEYLDTVEENEDDAKAMPKAEKKGLAGGEKAAIPIPNDRKKHLSEDSVGE